MKKYLLIAATTLLLASTNASSFAQNNTDATEEKSTINDPKMDWWKEARFGMFIHWGLYSVPAADKYQALANGL